MRKKLQNVPYRRKREGKTNYKKRLGLLKGGKPRLVIRGSSKNIIAQIIKYEIKGDKVIAASSSKELEKLGWKFSRSNIPAAYLTGLLLGKKASSQKLGEMVLDSCLRVLARGGRICAALKGCIDAGLDVKCDESILPSDDKVKGKHIVDYAVIKKDMGGQKLPSVFDEVKKKIIGGK